MARVSSERGGGFVCSPHSPSFPSPGYASRERGVRQPQGVVISLRAAAPRDRAWVCERSGARTALGLEGEVLLEELQEDPLRPLDVADIRGRDLALPVVRESERAQLALEVGDVRLRRLLGTRALAKAQNESAPRQQQQPRSTWRTAHSGSRGAAFDLAARFSHRVDRVLLGGQPERIPAHRVEHVEVAHAPVARHDIGRSVPLRMAHVQARTRRVREHVEHILLLLALAPLRREGVVLVPVVLPLAFDARVVVPAPRGRDRSGGRRSRRAANRGPRRPRQLALRLRVALGL